MSISVLFRPPLAWIVAAEIVVIAGLGLLTWHMWASRQAPPAVTAPPARAPWQSRPARTPVPEPSVPPRLVPRTGPTPGFRTDADFLSRQIGELNRVESTFEDAEWQVTRAAVDAIQRYLDGVVLPAIRRAQHGDR